MLFEGNYSSESESEDEEERERRLERRRKKNRKKRRIPKLANEMVVIKNVEKDSGGWMERWDKPKNRSAGLIPHPFRLLALGGVGRGKTNSCKNIFLKHQGQKTRKFKRLIIITCDANSQEWLDCDPEYVGENIPDLGQFDGKEKTCLVIDDYEHAKASKEEQKRLSTLMRYVSSHRNVSVMVSYQSFFDTPSICRKCANCFMIYKPNSRQECTTIENRVGLEKGTLADLFADRCSGIYDHVFIDKTIGTPYPLRKNIYEPLELV